MPLSQLFTHQLQPATYAPAHGVRRLAFFVRDLFRAPPFEKTEEDRPPKRLREPSRCGRNLLRDLGLLHEFGGVGQCFGTGGHLATRAYDRISELRQADRETAA
jgi:hypothetical protein